jgi:hypothetical protein
MAARPGIWHLSEVTRMLFSGSTGRVYDLSVMTFWIQMRFCKFHKLTCGNNSERDIAPCSFVEVDWHFRGKYCLLHQDESWSNSMRLHGNISQKAVIFILTTIRPWNLISELLF